MARPSSPHSSAGINEGEVSLPARRLPHHEIQKQKKWLRYLIKRQHGRCVYCDRVMVRGHPQLHPSFDHVEALGVGGRHHLENGKAACIECNMKKGNRVFVKNEN